MNQYSVGENVPEGHKKTCVVCGTVHQCFFDKRKSLVGRHKSYECVSSESISRKYNTILQLPISGTYLYVLLNVTESIFKLRLGDISEPQNMHILVYSSLSKCHNCDSLPSRTDLLFFSTNKRKATQETPRSLNWSFAKATFLRITWIRNSSGTARLFVWLLRICILVLLQEAYVWDSWSASKSRSSGAPREQRPAQ